MSEAFGPLVHGDEQGAARVIHSDRDYQVHAVNCCACGSIWGVGERGPFRCFREENDRG